MLHQPRPRTELPVQRTIYGDPSRCTPVDFAGRIRYRFKINDQDQRRVSHPSIWTAEQVCLDHDWVLRNTDESNFWIFSAKQELSLNHSVSPMDGYSPQQSVLANIA